MMQGEKVRFSKELAFGCEGCQGEAVEEHQRRTEGKIHAFGGKEDIYQRRCPENSNYLLAAVLQYTLS
jgi:hypothetical protein